MATIIQIATLLVFLEILLRPVPASVLEASTFHPLQAVSEERAVEALETVRPVKMQLVEQINRDRSRNGVPAVAYSEELSSLADSHCAEMLEYNYVSHWNRQGLKPYMRYSLAGVSDHTAENISSIRATRFDISFENLKAELMHRHGDLVHEEPPFDLHRRSILDPSHTHVGIGLAFDETGLRLIELFAKRYVTIEQLPSRAKLSDQLPLKGRVHGKGFEFRSISIYWEPLPRPPPPGELSLIRSYGFPLAEDVLRPKLPRSSVIQGRFAYPRYSDGTRGEVDIGEEGAFSASIPFSRGTGVYTVAVWLEPVGAEDRPDIMATNHCIFVR